jgi:hypothetical protein
MFEAETVTVPLPAGTVTSADVAVADCTVAGVDPKSMAACSSPRPLTVTVDPEYPALTEETEAQVRPAAYGLPIPVAAS